MTSEILKEILKREPRHISLYLDNAPCHRTSPVGCFSNITILLSAGGAGVNRPTDWRILEILLPRLQIQREILTGFRILQSQAIAVSSFLLAWITEFCL